MTFPTNAAEIVAGSKSEKFAPPLTEVAAPVCDCVASLIVTLRAVPHCAVVIAAVPLKFVPLIALAVVNFAAVEAESALPLRDAVIVDGSKKLTFVEPLTETAAP